MKHHQYIHKAILIHFYITVFSTAANLFLVWRIHQAFVQGHFIDYLAPKLYLNELLVLGLWATSWLENIITTRGNRSLWSQFRDFWIGLPTWLVGTLAF